MENNYSVGLKYQKAETKKPYKDPILKEILYDFNSINTYTFYEFLFAYNIKFKKHNLLLGAGPVLCNIRESFYDGRIYSIYVDETGQLVGVLALDNYLPVINERELWELGINPKIDYEYMISEGIGIGLKAEMYMLADIGLSFIFISPTIVFKL